MRRIASFHPAVLQGLLSLAEMFYWNMCSYLVVGNSKQMVSTKFYLFIFYYLLAVNPKKVKQLHNDFCSAVCILIPKLFRPKPGSNLFTHISASDWSGKKQKPKKDILLKGLKLKVI